MLLKPVTFNSSFKLSEGLSSAVILVKWSWVLLSREQQIVEYKNSKIRWGAKITKCRYK